MKIMGVLLAALMSSAAVAAEGQQHLSKMEARHTRQACERRASETGVAQAEREAFVKQCFEKRVARRSEARACRLERDAKGVDQAHRREFMRECIRGKIAGQK